MAEFFATGRIVDLILAFMLLEFIALMLIRRKSANAPRPLDILVSMGAGIALLMALRAALAGSRWQGMAVWLAAALAAHLLDLALRWSAAGRARVSAEH